MDPIRAIDHEIATAAEIVSRIAEEAQRILTGRVARCIGN
jgi:hypothetical protein